MPLTLSAVLDDLTIGLRERLAQQRCAPGHEHHGAIIDPEQGYPLPMVSTEFIHGVVLLAANGRPEGTAMRPAAAAALAYMRRSQRPSGLIDLPVCNYESVPDTGFVVQHFCAALQILRTRLGGVGEWDEFRSGLESFLRAAVPSMAAGGHHTPNHRWVIAAATAFAKTLLPDLPEMPCIEAYRAEGLDCNSDGLFIERSPLVYDPVNDRALLLLSEYAGWSEALPAVSANLAFNQHLLHADGTAETALSRRYDFGARKPPVQLIHCAALCHFLDGDARWAGFAEHMWDHAGEWRRELVYTGGLAWLGYVLTHYGELREKAPPPAEYSRYFPNVGLWRWRKGDASVSVFRNSPNLLTASFGPARLSGLFVQQTFFGPAGHFHGDRLEFSGESAVLHNTGHRHPRRPAYDLPLSRHVGDSVEEWDTAEALRAQHRLPPAAGRLEIHATDGRLDLRLTSAPGIDGVTGIISFDFAPGGTWESESTAFRPEPGQLIFLRSGRARMRYGSHSIEIGPGAAAHTMWEMKDAQPQGNTVRVVLALRTPVDHAFTIRFVRGWE